VEKALRVWKLGFVFRPVFHLQAHQEIANHLIFAFPVLGLGGVSEKGAELVLAESESSQGKYLEHVFILVVERDAEFAEDEVVVEGLFGSGYFLAFQASVEDDESVEKSREVLVVELFEVGIVFFFEPKGDFLREEIDPAKSENLGHLVVVKMKGIAKGAKDVVITHRANIGF
jgi:hypothetical protein